MQGFPSMKNSSLSHARTGLLIPINPCSLGSLLVVGLEFIFILNKPHCGRLGRELWLIFSGISDQLFGERPMFGWHCSHLPWTEETKISRAVTITQSPLFSPAPAPADLFPDTKRPSPLVSARSWCGPKVKEKDRKKSHNREGERSEVYMGGGFCHTMKA